MCGRYTLSVPLSDFVDVFDVDPPDFEYPRRYNIAPTQEAPVVAEDAQGRRMGLLRWGLVPPWAKDPSIGNRMINARSETVADKPAFRRAFASRRCLIPADGFFEWTKDESPPAGKGGKTPFWIHLASGEVFAFAGLWEGWQQPDSSPLYTFTILTTDASDSIRHIHPRMPVILGPAEGERWLDGDTSREDLLSLLRPWGRSPLAARPVSRIVNSPRNDAPGCIEPIHGDGEES